YFGLGEGRFEPAWTAPALEENRRPFGASRRFLRIKMKMRSSGPGKRDSGMLEIFKRAEFPDSYTS
ncbi:MAG: hypothetical protein OXN84_06255, partial [Albidovulum sp.]|nr:hypothetical protein [Albidovulum sp.]